MSYTFYIKTNCLNLLPVFMSLSQDYVDSLKGLCYDGMEGLLYLSLYSFLSALAFTAILCSLPGAWRSFHRLGELHPVKRPICCYFQKWHF